MKKLILDKKILLGDSLNKYEFLKKYGYNNLAELFKKDKALADIGNVSFFVKNINYEKDLKNYGFIESYNDWTNQLESWILKDKDYSIAIPVKTNKEGKAYLTSNMTNSKTSEKLINTLSLMIFKHIVIPEPEKKS